MANMIAWQLLVHSLVLATLWAPCNGVTFKKVSSVREAMYKTMQFSRACYKLLNATGAIGCEGTIPEAVLIHYDDLPGNLQGSLVVLVSADAFQTLARQVLTDQQMRAAVKGIMVNPWTGRPRNQSVSAPFPSAAFAPYSSPNHVWNPYGSGLDREYLGIPVYTLLEDVAADAAARADYNRRHGYGTAGAAHIAEMYLGMDAQHNSTHCLEAGTCLPVGGYSVWSALPPIPDTNYSASPAKPITLVLAPLDTNSFFHDLTRGANTAMSGVVTLLAAATLLAQSGAAANYSRQLVFSAVAGESWDYMGSRRMLFDMSNGTSATAGLRLDLIDQVINLGPLGLAYDRATNASTLYLHTQRGAPPSGGASFGDASALLAALQAAAADEAAASNVSISARAASASNPGVPPSSLMSFLRVAPAAAGLVLSEFDAAYRDPYVNSEWDDGTNMTLRALIDASVVLARALHTLAFNGAPPSPLKVDRAAATALVSDLTSCLVMAQPGLSCPLAAQLITASPEVVYGEVSYAVRGYSSILRGVAADPRDDRDKPTLQRFVWNYLANLTALVPLTAAAAAAAPLCDPITNLCPAPAALACVGWRFGDNPAKHAATMGRCLNTTTRYTPSYSTRFFFGVRGRYIGWFAAPEQAAAFDARYGWPADPAWVESNWQYGIPKLRMKQLEARSVQVGIIVAGFLLTLAAGVLSWIARAAFEKHLKND